MALETLENVGEIDGFKVAHQTEDSGMGFCLPYFINVDHRTNEITFRIQNGPIGEDETEGGVNGCQVDTLIATAKKMIEELNIKYPCGENGGAINHLNHALDYLKERKADRELRGVEGKNQV